MGSAERLMEVFDGARSRPAGPEREHFLDAACAGDSELRDQVQSLLEAGEEAGAFLGPSMLASAQLLTGEKPADVFGQRIGRYKLLEQIGEGGCGVVYMAGQEEPVRRRVALKVIKLGMDTKQVVARFEAERQALAMMDHPNIAKVFDAGATESGRPYFAMELVPGVKLTDYCDRNQLSTEARLQLFAQVCHAIQHAHQKGIIHRDIKPSNILVAESDGAAIPRVIDFGIAKATDQRLTDKTVFTAFEQFIGTPAYMSPEQATMATPDIDTRSDIYSLGVLLYELLTGKTPFDAETLVGAGIQEIRRIIHEDDPPKPSTRLSSLTHGDLKTAAASRRTDPPGLIEKVRGDLDWIVLKCLEKDRARRYETVNGLGRDIEHYLNNEPVFATPPSAYYRIRKFVRRHRGPVVAGMLLLLALVAGIVGTTWGMLRANKAEAVAVNEATQKSKRLWQALVAQARAGSLSGRPGRRFESLHILGQAAELGASLKLSAAETGEMRNAAITALSLPDVLHTGIRRAGPEEVYTFDFDASHTVYARTDVKGNCSIRRVSDDTELHHVPGTGNPAMVGFGPGGNLIGLRIYNEAATVALAVEIWSLDGGPKRILNESSARCYDFRDSQHVVVGYNDGTIRQFELPGGRQLSVLEPNVLTRELLLAVHPTEPIVATASYFHPVVQVRDLTNGNVLASIPQETRVSAIAWHPNGQKLVVGYAEERKVSFFSRGDWQVREVVKTEQAVTQLSLSADGNWLAITGWGGVMELFDVGSGTRLAMTPWVRGAQHFVWKDSQLAGAILDDNLGLWQVADGRECRSMTSQTQTGFSTAYILQPAMHPNGRWVAVRNTAGIEIFDLETCRAIGFQPTSVMQGYMLFQPNGDLLVSSDDGLYRWPVKESGNGTVNVGPPQQLPIRAHEGLSQSADGKVIVTCNRRITGREQFAGGWIFRTDRPGDDPIPLDKGQDLGAIAVSPDGRVVFTATHTPGIPKIWDATDGAGDNRLIRQLSGRGAGGWSRFSPDGRWLYTTVDGGWILDTESWTRSRRIPQRAVFFPDSELVAVPGSDGVRLIEHRTGREIAFLTDPDMNPPVMVTLTPDGRKLIGLSRNTGIQVWDLSLIRRELKSMNLDWDWPEFSGQ